MTVKERVGSNAEESLATLIRWEKLDYGMKREYRFAPPRRWRFDFAWPHAWTAIEVEGGGFISGRHTRGAAFEKDAEKYNAAVIRHWQVLRVTPAMVDDGRAVAALKELWGISR
jgi:hypothetical protein